MSVFRRPTRAAGESWSKWEDPIVYKTPLSLKLGHWAFWLLLGASVGYFAVLAIVARALPDNLQSFLAVLASYASAVAAGLGLLRTWVEIQEYRG